MEREAASSYAAMK